MDLSIGTLLFFFVQVCFIGSSSSRRCDHRNETEKQALSSKEKLDYFVLCENKSVTGRTTTRFVIVNFSPIHFDIVEQTEGVRVFGNLYVSWMHKLYSWDPKKYGSITEWKADSIDDWDNFWAPNIAGFTPNLMYYRSPSSSMENRYDFKDVIIKSIGLVTMNIFVKLVGTCKHNYRAWPLDKWECRFRLLKLSNPNDRVQLRAFDAHENINLTRMQENPLWEVLSSPPFVVAAELNSTVELSITVQKDPSHSKHIFIVPGVVLFLLSLTSFLLTDHIYCRMMINRFVVLIQLTMLLYMFWFLTSSTGTESVGRGIKGVRLFDFYLDSVFISLIGLLLAIVNAALIRKMTDPPEYITKTIGSLAEVPYLGPVFSYFIINNHIVLDHSSLGTDESGLIATNLTKNENAEWKTICNVLDRGAFILISFYFFVVYVLC